MGSQCVSLRDATTWAARRVLDLDLSGSRKKKSEAAGLGGGGELG